MLLMTMSKKYWIQRFEKEEARNAKISLQHMQVAKQQYQNTVNKIDSEIRSWYSKYSKDNKVSYEEAQKMLSRKDSKSLKMSLKEYIKLGEQQNVVFDSQVEKLLKKVSAEIHVNRLESIRSSIQAELDILYTNLERGLGNHFSEVVGEGYARTNYLVQSMKGNFESISGLNKDTLDKVIYRPWTSDGTNWSKRIWKQKDKLIEEIHTSLVQSLVLGDDINLLADKMAKRLDVGFSRATNLLMTESAAYHSKATEICYKDLKVEKYEILATLDNRTSSVCQGMDGKIFERKQYQVGVTAPPFHCRCRSTTIPYFEDLTEDETRATRDEEGNHVEEKTSMKYPEWEEKYLKESTKDSIINIEVDEMTPCLRRLKDGTIVKTEVKEIKYKKVDFKDWLFDWSKTEKKGYQILALYAEDDSRIQGAVSIKPRKDNLTVEIDIAESAPFNRLYKNKEKEKEYSGVGAHLFAEVCKRSFEIGYDGYVEFKAKTNLVDYYREKLGAIAIDTQRMYIDTDEAKKLIEKYYGGGEI